VWWNQDHARLVRFALVTEHTNDTIYVGNDPGDLASLSVPSSLG
jgi:hypothetical protein